MSELVISGAASQKFPFWIRSGSLGGLRPGRRKKDYASRAHTKAPNSRTLRSIPLCVAARETSTKKINDIPIRLPPVSWLVCGELAINLRSISTDLLRKLLSCNSTVRVYIRDLRALFRREALSCVVHPQDENIGMVAAGASEQQEQHELEEESGFVGTRVKGGERQRATEEERKTGRAMEERIEEEIPSRRVLAMCDPV